MSFESSLLQAVAKNQIQTIVDVFATEKCSKLFADRLDIIVVKELGKNQFKSVTLIVKAIEKVMEQDADCYHKLVQQGVVVMMLNWYERTVELMTHSVEDIPDQMDFLEAFYDIAVKVSHSIIEGKTAIRALLILRFGALVVDEEKCHKLRLDAIQTINLMVDGISKEERRDLCHTTSLSRLLEDFAHVLLKGGDYEFQVAVTEALSRMTIKKTREEFGKKWFGDKKLASSFMAIKYKEFETDCRTFINEVNCSFGDARRVYTFPCVKAYLDSTELFKPEDVNLKEFWIDFNISSSCITFSVHDPESALWGSVCLMKMSVDFCEVLMVNEHKVLTVHSTSPVNPYGKISGQHVQMFFSSGHDIAAALQRVFGDAPQSKGALPEQEASSQGMSTEDSLSESPATLTQKSPSPQKKNGEPEMSKTDEASLQQADVESEASPMRDVFVMREDSDTEVMKARARFMGKSPSTNGSSLGVYASAAVEEAHQKARAGRRTWDDLEGNSIAFDKLSPCQRSSPIHSYTRKKPRVKSRLRVLPLSSPSSGEESHAKAFSSTSKTSAANQPVTHDNSESTKDHTEKTAESGFLEPSVFESPIRETLPCDLDKESALAQESSVQARKRPLKNPEPSVMQKREQAEAGLQLRGMFHSGPQGGAAGLLRNDAVMVGEEDSEADIMGPDVMSAFRSFKSQLLDHVFAKYQKIEARSLQSLSDCQDQVMTLLKTVQSQRVQLLERFEEVVVEQLGCLERDCRSLKNIERETMTFWKTENQAVRSFCERQQSRLESLEIYRGNATRHSPPGQAEEEAETMKHSG